MRSYSPHVVHFFHPFTSFYRQSYELLFNEARVSAAPRIPSSTWYVLIVVVVSRRERKREREKEPSEQEKEGRLDERVRERSIVIIVYHKESAVDFRTRHSSVPRLAIFSAIRSPAADSSIYNHFCAALPDR